MKRVLAAAAAVALTGLVVAPAAAEHLGLPPNSVTYSGQGWSNGAPEEEDCEDGPNQLLWVLAGSSATEAVIYANGELVGEMTKEGNGNAAFKFETDYFDPTGIGIVVYYDGPARNAQFVISHGCPPDSITS